MRNRIKHILILLLVLMFVLPLAIPNMSYADSMPYSDQYEEVSITVNGKAIADIAYTCKGNMYLPISVLKKYGDVSKLTIDTANSKITFDLSKMSFNFGDTEINEFVKTYAGECYVPIKTFKNDSFVSLGSIDQMAKLTWSYSNGRLLISQYSKSTNLASVGLASSSAPSLKNRSIASLSTGEKVFIVKESKSFYKVETMDGNQYYVNKTDVKKIDDVSKINDFEYIPDAKDVFTTQINMGWLPLSDTATRSPLPDDNTTGVDVLSPIWMHLPVGKDGYVRHLCDYGYVELAHELGYKVWMCANNNFMDTGSTKYTTSVLGSKKLRNKVIAQYLVYACIYKVDGINLDFESMVNADKSNFTEFNKTLGTYCSKLGITYSISTYPCNTSNSNRYDWTALASYSDYLVPMMYSSLVSNSVPQSIASLSWYQTSLGNLANLIPANKIIVGIPLFTRYWFVNENDKILDSSNVKSNTDTISMLTLTERMSERQYTKTWDDTTKQYILKYVNDDGKTVKAWIEEERSIAEKLKLVKNSGFAGTACWALTQEYEGMLNIFNLVYKQGIDPQTILDKYQ